MAVDKLPLVGVTPAEVVSVPFEQIARETGGSDRAKNTVVIGLMAGWLGIGKEQMLAGIRKKLSKKGAEVVEKAEKAFHAGLAYAEQHPLKHSLTMAEPEKAGAKFVVDGNDLCAAAAIVAGLRLLQRLPDHAVVRDHALPRPRDLEVRRHDAAGRRRDRGHRRRRRARRSRARRR